MLHFVPFMKLHVFHGMRVIIEYLIAVLRPSPNKRTKSKHRLRFHRAAFVCQERLSFDGHRVEAGRLANIDLDHGRDIVGPSIETALFCHAGFVLSGRRSTSQGPKTSLQDLYMKEESQRLLSAFWILNSCGAKRKRLICSGLSFVIEFALSVVEVPLWLFWLPMQETCVNRFSRQPSNSMRII